MKISKSSCRLSGFSTLAGIMMLYLMKSLTLDSVSMYAHQEWASYCSLQAVESILIALMSYKEIIKC